MGDQRAPYASIDDIGARFLRSRWFLGLASAAILALLVLVSWPWCSNRFALEATTQIVEVWASAPGVHVIGVKLPKFGEIRIFGAHADGLPPDLATLAADAISVRLAASSATLQSISLPGGSALIVRATSDGGADIGVLNEGRISLVLSGVIERIDENEERSMMAKIERATAWEIMPAERNSPAQVVLPPGSVNVAIHNQPIGDFWFRPPRPAGDDPHTFRSEILDGELQLLDTGAKVKLQPHELVLLEGGSRMLSRLEVAHSTVAVYLSGEAERISAGPPRPGNPFRLDRDLTPSTLSYLVGQHELKLLWGIAVAVLGALWKAHQWALKWDK